MVPLNDQVADVLGVTPAVSLAARLVLPKVEVEKAMGEVRPDLLAHSDLGVAVAIEVAYTSFCDMLKVEEFARLGLPVLEIDLRAFTPDAFSPEAVKQAVLEAVAGKEWLWPRSAGPAPEIPTAPQLPQEPTGEPPKVLLPEEIVTISGRWVSIKEFESGDIAVKVIRYDPDVVSLVKSIAKANFGHYSPRWKSWNVPRWRASIVRTELRSKSETVSIVLNDRG
jgi:hypothetical protein